MQRSDRSSQFVSSSRYLFHRVSSWFAVNTKEEMSNWTEDTDVKDIMDLAVQRMELDLKIGEAAARLRTKVEVSTQTDDA
jgi:hypothetical protein